MERAFGRSGRSVPTIGLGTWNMERAPKSSGDAVRRAVELGLTHIDTAELYGSGRVESLLGEALAGLRDQVFLASKVLPSNASRKGVVRACEDSLRRLKTDRLDLYLLHWESHHPVAETIAGFEELVRAGKILAWGVSNFDESQMDDVEVIAPGRMACNQVLYHLKERAIEHAVLPWCAEHDVALVAYSPFGSGDFPEPSSSAGRVLAQVASRHGATPRQVALAFLVREAPLFAIPKASVVAHVEEIAGNVNLSLTEDDLADIDRAFPRGRPRDGVPMIQGGFVQVDAASSVISDRNGDASTSVVSSDGRSGNVSAQLYTWGAIWSASIGKRSTTLSTSCTAEIVSAATRSSRSGSSVGSGSCSIACPMAPITSCSVNPSQRPRRNSGGTIALRSAVPVRA